MIIAFQGPVFFAATDEDQFFGWLRSLPEFQSIRGIGTTLELDLAEPVTAETAKQLVVIFRRWQLDVASLSTLRTAATTDFILWDTGLSDASVNGA